MQGKNLTLKQEWFCKYYMEEKWNATQAYIKAYSVKNKWTAKTNASRMLTNANIWIRIGELLNEEWLNDMNIDTELLGLVKQNDNLGIKLRAITEYNKLRKRYDESLKVSTWVIVLPSQIDDSNLYNIDHKPYGEMSIDELQKEKHRLLKG